MRTCACCSGRTVRRGLWSPDEDKKLKGYVQMHGCKSWNQVPLLAGLERCGKSCRLRWINYLRPGIKRGQFSTQEQQLIFDLQAVYGNRWAWIAKWIPGRTDNEIKNFWKVHKKSYNGPLEFDRVSKYRLAMPLWIDICEPSLEEGAFNKCEAAAVEFEAEAENAGTNSTYCNMEKSNLDTLDDLMSDMCWFDEELQEFMVHGRLQHDLFAEGLAFRT